MFENMLLVLILCCSVLGVPVESESATTAKAAESNTANEALNRSLDKEGNIIYASANAKQSPPATEKEKKKEKTAKKSEHKHSYKPLIETSIIPAQYHMETMKISDGYTEEKSQETTISLLECPDCHLDASNLTDEDRIAHLMEHHLQTTTEQAPLEETGQEPAQDPSDGEVPAEAPVLLQKTVCTLCNQEIAENDVQNHFSAHIADGYYQQKEKTVDGVPDVVVHDPVYQQKRVTDVPGKKVEHVTEYECENCHKKISVADYDKKYNAKTEDKVTTLTLSAKERIANVTIPDFSVSWYWDSQHNDFPLGLCTWYATGVLNQLYGDVCTEGFTNMGYSSVLAQNVINRYPDLFEYGPPGSVPKPGAVFSTSGQPAYMSQFHTGIVVDVQGDVVTIFDGNYNNKGDTWDEAVNPNEYSLRDFTVQEMYDNFKCYYANPID